MVSREVRIYGDGNSKPVGAEFEASFVPGKGMILTFRLPNPDTVDHNDDWVIEGEIVIDWVKAP